MRKRVFHRENVENVENFPLRGCEKPRKQAKPSKLPTPFSTLSPVFCGELGKIENCAICTKFPFYGRKTEKTCRQKMGKWEAFLTKRGKARNLRAGQRHRPHMVRRNRCGKSDRAAHCTNRKKLLRFRAPALPVCMAHSQWRNLSRTQQAA